MPPLIGWNDWPSDADWSDSTPCQLSSAPGYILYSSSGSFFIPMAIIIFVYIKVRRERREREGERGRERRGRYYLP